MGCRKRAPLSQPGSTGWLVLPPIKYTILMTTLRRSLFVFGWLGYAAASMCQTYENSWPVPNEAVYAIAHDPTSNTVFVGGIFTTMNGQPRSGLASMDATTGALRSWAPTLDGFVYTLKLVGNTLYVGGDFEIVNTLTRNNLCAFDVTTGAVSTTWNPNVDGSVLDIEEVGGTLYIAGIFYGVQGVVRYGVAAVSTSGFGMATPWDPGLINDFVRTVEVSGNTVYIGGQFDMVDGNNREYVAAINRTTGAVLPWDPSPGDRVTSVYADGNTTYVMGSFYGIGGASRTGIGAIDGTGSATSWNAGLNEDGLCATRAGNVLYAGGSFTMAGGQARNGLAALDVNTGLATTWDPGLAYGPNIIYVNEVVVGGGRIFVGGDFQTVNGTLHPYFAVWSGAPLVGVEEHSDLPTLDVYPNPSTGCLTLRTNDPAAQRVLIEDALGRQVRSLPFRASLDISDLAVGTYIVTISDVHGTALSRASVVKE